jgi:hypothetical protein
LNCSRGLSVPSFFSVAQQGYSGQPLKGLSGREIKREKGYREIRGEITERERIDQQPRVVNVLDDK